MPLQTSFSFGGEQLPCDGSALLFPNFLSPSDAEYFFAALMQDTPWEQAQLGMFGNIVNEPRMSAWHSNDVAYAYSGRERRPHPFGSALEELRRRCSEQTETAFNGALVNLYRNGDDHLGWHADDEMVNGPEPVIASISLGAERRFDFRHNETNEVVKVLLPHGSLLVMSGLSQACWKHRIPKDPGLSTARINVTFRKVLNLS